MKQEYIVAGSGIVVLGLVALFASVTFVPTEFRYPESEAYIKGAVPAHIEHFESY